MVAEPTTTRWEDRARERGPGQARPETERERGDRMAMEGKGSRGGRRR